MRALSGGLTAAQQSPSATPYILVIAYLGGAIFFDTEGIGGGPPIYSIRHTEEPYSGKATITFKDPDHFFNAHDLTGYQIGIGYGYKTPGNEYSIAAPLWVVSQNDVSQEGILLTELVCIDIWQKMDYQILGPDPTTGDPKFQSGWNVTSKTLTIEGIIYDLLQQLNPPVAYTEDSSDGLINSIMPAYQADIGTPLRTVLRDMLMMTRSGLRMHPTTGMHALYLDPASPAVYTYDTVHAHFSNIRQTGLTLPNDIIYVSSLPTDASAESAPKYKGEATDPVSIARFGKVYGIFAPPEGQAVASDAECVQMANTILGRIQSETDQGRISVQHNCGQELFDPITIIDSRNGITFSGRVGGLYHNYDCGESGDNLSGTADAITPSRSYTLEIRLGGLVESLNTSSPDALIGELWGLSLIHPWPNLSGTRGGVIMPATDLPPNLQEWTSDLIFEPGRTSGADLGTACHWKAGHIYFPGGSVINVNPGQLVGIAFAETWYIYWDLSAGDPENLKSSKDMNDVLNPNRGLLATATGVIPEGIILLTAVGPGVQVKGGMPNGIVVTADIALKAITTALIADGAVVNVKVAQGAIDSGKLANLAVTTEKMANAIVTHDKMAPQAINHEDIRVGAIYGDRIAAGGIAADAIAAGAISADKIAANAVVADKIAANAIISDKIMANAIVAGKIASGAVTADKISVTSLSAISANLGVVTTGLIRSLWSGGSVYWVGGLSLRRIDNAIQWGWIGDVGTGMMEVRSSGNIPLLIGCGSEGAVFVAPNSDQWGPMANDARHWYFRTFNISGSTQVNHSFSPRGHFIGCLGWSDHAWAGVYTYALKVAVTQAWQGHDDIKLVKAIKTREVGGKRVLDTNSLPAEMVESCPTVKDQGPWSNAVSSQVDHYTDVGSMLGLHLGAIQEIINRLEKVERKVGV